MNRRTDAIAATDRPPLNSALAGGLDARRHAPRSVRSGSPNALIVMQPLCPDDQAEPTTDPNDMAHGCRYALNERCDGLRPAREVPASAKRPRRYHRQYMIGPDNHRVSFETAFEETEARRARLRAELGEIDGITDQIRPSGPIGRDQIAGVMR